MTGKILVFLLIFFASSKIFSFGGGHDSLLFDDSGTKISVPYSNECKVKVVQVSGLVIGSVKIMELLQACGEEVDTVYRTLNGEQLKVGFDIVENEEVKTGEDGFVKLELADGSVMIVGPNSSLMFTENLCKETKTVVKLINGSIWTKVKKLLGGGKFEISTENGGGGVRGTEFTYEVLNGKDIVKVYEGSFEVNPPKDMSELESSAKQMEQLQKDYEAGKMTTEEFTTKLLALSQLASQQAGEIKPTLVEAGYMVTLTNKIGMPEPIPPGETKWFEDARFK
ncbi:MAG: FecR domain-containing protein [Ignavibacteria bacterium]|nr:FecR domain-containing protein [Ignavibacteria bacterium]